MLSGKWVSQSLDDIAAYRKKLREAEAQCQTLQQQVHDHRDSEIKLRQRMSELRIKVLPTSNLVSLSLSPAPPCPGI
jgi:uncharacterized protein YhaN